MSEHDFDAQDHRDMLRLLDEHGTDGIVELALIAGLRHPERFEWSQTCNLLQASLDAHRASPQEVEAEADEEAES